MFTPINTSSALATDMRATNRVRTSLDAASMVKREREREERD